MSRVCGGGAGCGIICGMEKMKQIMYGVTDFARIRAENGYFVDRTAFIV